MTEQEFADRENWLGSFYELGIEVAPGDLGRMMAALHALWQHPLLEGPFAGPYSAPQPALTPATIPSTPENMGQLYGLLHLPHHRAIGCSSLLTGPGTDALAEIASRYPTWLILCIPMGMLELAYPVEYPIVGATNPWIDEFEHILIGIAESIYQKIPFDLAVIGEEAAAFADAESTLTAERVDRGGYLLAPTLAAKLHPRRTPERCPSGLLWFPWAT